MYHFRKFYKTCFLNNRMEKQDLYFVLFEQQKNFEDAGKDLVDREAINQILELISLKLPIVLTGVRRCGKSSLLRLIKDKLNLEEKGFLYVNFNDERLINFSIDDFQKILDYVEENDYKKNCVFFFDEIQETSSWEKWVDRIKQKHTIFLTGSNSKLLSKEISSVLTGRSINLSLFPFSFTEFLNYKKSLEIWPV